jgi:putative endonuclease
MFTFKQAKTAHLRIGRRGEKLACRYLHSNNIEILLRNYRNKRGEIDIIARDGNIICFIEVKTRRLSTRSRPAAGLRHKQKLRISQSASRYLSEIARPKVTYRFDLIEIVLGRWDICELRYWKNHFTSKKR